MSDIDRWIIGRSSDCDIVVNQTSVSSKHCRLLKTDDGFIIEDLQSSNGTFVNGKRVSGRMRVTTADKVTLGLTTPMPWPKTGNQAAVPPRAPAPKPVAKQSKVRKTSPPAPAAPPASPSSMVTIGRAPDNDVVLDYPMVSGHHARLVLSGPNHGTIQDLDSANGTAIGSPENKVQQAQIQRDDVVFFGSLPIPAAQLFLSAGSQQPSASPQAAVPASPAAPPPIPVPPPVPGMPPPMPASPARPAPSGLTAATIQHAAIPDGAVPQTSISVSGDDMLIGRSTACDHVLNYPMISSRHARIFRHGSQMFLEDLQSTNGTYLNHQRIFGQVPVNPGDVIGLGSYTFIVQPDGDLYKRDSRGNVTIDAQNVAVDVPGKRLLEGCSFTIYPKEIVGLMGPSGAGKTTLMRAINGYTPPSEGAVLLNGVDLYEHFDQYRVGLGYVPQDDIIHRDLTVFQALFYSARLRLPPDFTDDDIRVRIQTVLKQLQLEGVENVLIGSPERKGISGGQRKRVNLAMELLTDPLVLFLDEPTSGLSSEDAFNVMNVLRELADNGKTILITIHQPSLEVYKLMDNLLMVGKDANSPEPGRVIFYGGAYPDAIQFFRNTPAGSNADLSPDEIFREMKKQPCNHWLSKYYQSPQFQEYVHERARKPIPGIEGQALHETGADVSSFLQWWTLLRRCVAIKIKDRMNTAILLAQAPIIAILIVMVFGKQAQEELTFGVGDDYQQTIQNFNRVANGVGTALFLMTLAALWFGSSNAVREIVGEWAIYQRERMVNLKIIPYLVSKFAVLGGLCVVQCGLLMLIVSWGCDLQASKFLLFFFLFSGAFIGVAIGLTLSAVAKTSEVAIALLPIVLLGIVILGGGIQPIHEMHKATQLVSYPDPARWAFEGMVVTESGNRPKLRKFEERQNTPPGVPAASIPKAEIIDQEDQRYDNDNDDIKDMADRYFPKKDERHSRGVDVFALFILFSLFASLLVVILKMRDIQKGGKKKEQPDAMDMQYY